MRLTRRGGGRCGSPWPIAAPEWARPDTRTAILKLILALGRYAMLRAVAVALAVFATRIVALEHCHGLAISSVVLPFTTGAVFLAFGLLLLPGAAQGRESARRRASNILGSIRIA